MVVAKRSVRGRLMQALHAEGRKRGLDHDGLRDVAREAYRVESLSELSVAQLRAWTSDLRKTHRGMADQQRRNDAGRAGRKGDHGNVLKMPTAEDLELLAGYRQALGWSAASFETFVRRQLGGRAKILTTADLNKVLWPMKRLCRVRGGRKQ